MDLNISKPLVADYDSSDEEDEKACLVPGKENHAVPLISASEILDKNSSDVSSSVFTNPYQVAENYEQSILEKHVKMTEIKEPELKNKKICFKFSKGKCKLGDNCSFRHLNPTQINDLMRITDDEEIPEKNKEKSKRRCGLKDDLVPPKKYMKTYNNYK
ncbi:hypothetical protein CDAR_5311 [Caerostris darwini]|uniref:C3H1-type domain-containing protein n=1 Tax=Caerostris darwini TaxID=1538125 RepID=A0AAV4P598_9ARAC|nr:hypothetical protein CDAR_5311 [Caerostris darwini]